MGIITRTSPDLRHTAEPMDGFEFPVAIVRTSRRRSATIQVQGAGILVRTPKTLAEHRIRELITRHTPWIRRKLKEAEMAPVIEPRKYVAGEKFSYLGRNYRLKIVHGDLCSLKLKGGYLVATVSHSAPGQEAQLRSLVTGWYRERAQQRLAEKTGRYAGIIGVTPRSMRLKTCKSRWGSCSARGDISYNWCIILAPHRIVDYVVVHELCHLLEQNHSPRYWQHVQRHVPDYKERREWLRVNGARLLLS